MTIFLLLGLAMVCLVPNVNAVNYWDFLTQARADSLYCSLFGCTMKGDIDMAGYNITNAVYVNATYVNISVNSTQVNDPIWLNLTGGTLTGDVDMDNNHIDNVGNLTVNDNLDCNDLDVDDTLKIGSDGSIIMGLRSYIRGFATADVRFGDSIIPTINNVKDVGNTSHGWRNGYFSGNITADNYFGSGAYLTNVAGANSSWNESYADTLYSNLSNIADHPHQDVQTTASPEFLRMGIGVASSVTYPLNVKTSVAGGAFLQQWTADDNGAVASMTKDSSDNGVFIVNAGNSAVNIAFQAAGNSWVKGGNFGMGTSAPDTILHAFRATGDTILKVETDSSDSGHSAELNLDRNDFTGKSRVSFSFRDTEYWGIETLRLDDLSHLSFVEDGTNSRMIIRDGGDVGIGTITPTAKLDVNGSINVTGNGNVTASYFVGDGSQLTGINANGSIWNRSGTDVILANTGDSVGIGTDTPTAKLDVNGSINVTEGGNVTASYFKGDGSLLTGLSGDNASWNESYANTLYLQNYSVNGTHVNITKLEVDGNITLDENIVINNFDTYGAQGNQQWPLEIIGQHTQFEQSGQILLASTNINASDQNTGIGAQHFDQDAPPLAVFGGISQWGLGFNPQNLIFFGGAPGYTTVNQIFFSTTAGTYNGFNSPAFAMTPTALDIEESRLIKFKDNVFNPTHKASIGYDGTDVVINLTGNGALMVVNSTGLGKIRALEYATSTPKDLDYSEDNKYIDTLPIPSEILNKDGKIKVGVFKQAHTQYDEEDKDNCWEEPINISKDTLGYEYIKDDTITVCAKKKVNVTLIDTQAFENTIMISELKQENDMLKSELCSVGKGAYSWC